MSGDSRASNPTGDKLLEAASQAGTERTSQALSGQPDADGYGYSFEEFRLMYESTELVSDRKINFTRANSSLCLAIIAGQALAISWVFQKPQIEPVAYAAAFIVSILGMIFCIYWNGQLWAFKDLNTAKFKVLEEMATRVVFPDYRERAIKSMNPFFREYQILQDKNKLGIERGALVQKANFAETVVPKSFFTFFAMDAALCVFLLVNSLA
jgi:hypothetical protein